MDPNLPDGTYPWRSSRSILKRGSSITLASSPDTLAGSAVSLDECVRNLSTFASIPLSRAIVCASGNAAGSLGGGVERSKGRLEVGWDADLAVWSRMEGKVVATWVRGREAWAARR
jgi:N-acetylglucosamine-6-phosphate deacetylase